jgi:hypothetical protein
VRHALAKLRVPWFLELVSRRARQIRDAICERVGPELADHFTVPLAALSEDIVSTRA